MKKINFLSSLSACAMAAVMLTGAAMLTSCAKEELNVNTTPVEQTPATVSINPVVLDMATGRQVDAFVSFSGMNVNEHGVITGNKNIEAGTVTVNAVLNGATGSATVSVPALKAGQSATFAPVVVLSTDAYYAEMNGSYNIDFEHVEGTIYATPSKAAYSHDGWEVDHDFAIDHEGNTWRTNMTEFSVPTKFEWTITATAEMKNKVYESTYAGMPVMDFEKIDYTLEGNDEEWTSAWCIYRWYAETHKGTVDLDIYSTATGAKVGYVAIENSVAAVTSVYEEQAIPGYTEHDYTHGHSHGKNPNAGGGFVIAD